MKNGADEPMELPINGVLDLHTVDSRDVHWLADEAAGGWGAILVTLKPPAAA